MGLKETLKLIDGQRSVSKEFRVRTAHGALLSVTTLILIAYLVYIEFKFNFKTEVLEKVHVNATTSAGLEIEFDVTLHEVPCAILAVDATDPTNQRQSLHLDQKHHVWKHRIDKIGRLVGPKIKVELGSSLLDEQILLESIQNTTQDESEITLQDIHLRESECGSCYGAGEESECCNTCDDVKRAYQRKGWSLKNEIDTIEQCKNQVTARDEEGEGCNVHAKIALSTGGGEVHLAPSRGLDHNSRSGSILDVFLQTFEAFNVSHTVQKMRFGPEFPGSVHQLDDAKRNLEDSYGMYQYYFQIVPTTYKYLDGRIIQTYQFSVTEHMRHVSPGSGRGLPGVFFFYEVSALHVVIEESRRGWISFFTSVAAIVGGVVTVLGMLDQALYSKLSSHKHVGLMR
mmetsp:Transcript_12774/g.18788  ORF Transcript_12774/g.18788 Transcript_12774/m.18788 type:complete len:399 (+) Transcript_12774:83-1279(+)